MEQLLGTCPPHRDPPSSRTARGRRLRKYMSKKASPLAAVQLLSPGGELLLARDTKAAAQNPRQAEEPRGAEIITQDAIPRTGSRWSRSLEVIRVVSPRVHRSRCRVFHREDALFEPRRCHLVEGVQRRTGRPTTRRTRQRGDYREGDRDFCYGCTVSFPRLRREVTGYQDCLPSTILGSRELECQT